MIATKEYIINSSIESDYSKSISIEHRKKFAQFFTPFPIADLMAKWILWQEEKNRIPQRFSCQTLPLSHVESSKSAVWEEKNTKNL